MTDKRISMLNNYVPTPLGHLPWIIAANAMIARACLEQYLWSNLKKDGTRVRKSHVPYTVPEWVKSLIKAISEEDEHEVKRIMHVVRCGCFSLV